MSDVFTSAGTVLSTSRDIPVAYNKNEMRQLNWHEIGEVVDIGEFGREFSLVSHNPITSKKTVKRKGSRDEGSLTISFAKSPGDEGQSIIKEGLILDRYYPFKIELPDRTTQYFLALITSVQDVYGDVNSIASGNIVVGISRDILPGSSISEASWYNYFFEKTSF